MNWLANCKRLLLIISGNRKLLIVIKILLTLLILYLIFSQNKNSLRLVFRNHLQLIWLIPAALNSLLVMQVLAAYRWKQFLIATKGDYRLSDLLRINFVSIFYGLLLPSSDGFALFRIIILENECQELRAKATASVILEKLTGILLLLATALFSLLFLMDIFPVKLFFFIIIALFFIASVLFLLKSSFLLIEKSGKKICSFISKTLESIHEVRASVLVIRAIPLVLIVQLLSYLNVYFIFRVFDINISFVKHVSYLPLIQIISLIPLTISGLGIRESAFVFFYKHLNPNNSLLIFVSLLNFFILSVIPALIGGLINLFTVYSHRKIPANSSLITLL